MKWKKRMEVNFFPALSEFIGKPFRYLEIGVFRGTTTKWVLDNIATHPDCLLIGIDPWDRKFFRRHDIRSDAEWQQLLDTVEEIELNSHGKIRFIKGTSENVLKEGAQVPSGFNAVYIDGEHTKEAVQRDFYLVWPHLQVGGVLIFDDYLMVGNEQMKTAIDELLEKNKDSVELLIKNRQVVIRKTK